MSKRKDSENPTLAQISMKIEFLDRNINKISLALWGKNGRGGMIKDMQEIKSSLNATTSIIKSIGVPIIAAVISAVITACVLSL